MSTETVSVLEAQTRLRELIGLAQQGSDIVITENGRIAVRLVPVPCAAKQRVFGLHKGSAVLKASFDAPVPDEFWLGKDQEGQ